MKVVSVPFEMQITLFLGCCSNRLLPMSLLETLMSPVTLPLWVMFAVRQIGVQTGPTVCSVCVCVCAICLVMDSWLEWNVTEHPRRPLRSWLKGSPVGVIFHLSLQLCSVQFCIHLICAVCVDVQCGGALHGGQEMNRNQEGRHWYKVQIRRTINFFTELSHNWKGNCKSLGMARLGMVFHLGLLVRYTEKSNLKKENLSCYFWKLK